MVHIFSAPHKWGIPKLKEKYACQSPSPIERDKGVEKHYVMLQWLNYLRSHFLYSLRTNYSHVTSSSSLSDASFLWFAWLNEPMGQTNRAIGFRLIWDLNLWFYQVLTTDGGTTTTKWLHMWRPQPSFLIRPPTPFKISPLVTSTSYFLNEQTWASNNSAIFNKASIYFALIDFTINLVLNTRLSCVMHIAAPCCFVNILWCYEYCDPHKCKICGRLGFTKFQVMV